MQYSEKISNKLNDLLEKNYDAKQGYELAADKVENPTVTRFINDKVSQRSEFTTELKNEIREYGELKNDSGSFKGEMHRNWMNLTSSISGDNTERILEEIERGEKAALESYNDVLSNEEISLEPSTRNLLTKQRNNIQAALNTAQVYEEQVS